MANLNPLGAFVAGKQAGIGLQQQQLGLQQAQKAAPRQNILGDLQVKGAQRQEQQAGVTQESARIQFMNKAGKALLQLPEDQRSAAFAKLEPLSQQVGIVPGTFTPERMTDQSLNQLIATTERFAQDPQSLERERLRLQELTITERSKLAAQKPELAGQTEAAKIEAQRGRKAEVAEEVTRATEGAKSATKVIDKSFENIGKAQKNISNIDRAISALDRGASTGAVQRFLPSVKAASVELDQIRNELGLDVIGGVTFGALSKGELDLALDTALPTKLNKAELKDFLVRKKDAQLKVMANLQEAIQFLNRPGSTVADFVASKRQAVQQAPRAQPQQFSDGQTATNPTTGQKIIFQNGQWVSQ